LDINLQKARMQLGVQILVDDPNQLEEIRKRYVNFSLGSRISADCKILESPR